MADKENNTPEEKTHIWTDEEIRSLIEWRIKNEKFFTGKRYSSKTGWLKFVNTSGLQISAKQAGKKWNNMKDKYKELKDPPTGKGVEAGSVTAATWKWYSEMDAALGGQHSVNAPLVVASSLTANSGGVVRLDPASTPSTSTSEAEDEGRGRPKRKREEVLDFLREQAEREEERHREDIKREEEREKAAAQRAERYLSLFEKLVDKM